MPNREKVTKHFEHLLNAAKGNYQDFVDLTVDVGEEILAMLQEQEDLGTELTNAVELIHKKNERIEKLEKLLKEQQQQIWEFQDQVEYLTDKQKEQEEELSYREAKSVTHTATKLDDATCPSCGNVVGEKIRTGAIGQSVVQVRWDYCRFCGQKLDWEGRRSE